MKGDIYKMHFDGQGHALKGERFAVVVQSEDLYALSTWLVAPTSGSDHAAQAIYRPELEIDGRPGRIMVEQMRAVNWERLGTHVGVLTHEQLQALDRALRLVMELD